jgi:mannose-6-phosphate isomerase-like protein (cupin superfamily)
MMSSEAVAGAIVRLPNDGEAIWFLRNRMTIKATAQTTGGAYGLVESWLVPGFSPPLHVHHREDEAFWVLEGTMTFRCGGTTTAAGPGSYLFLPRDVPHTFVVEGNAPAHILTLLSPGGGEAFFAAAGRPAEHDGFPPPVPADIDLLRRAGAMFGMEILGPPMEPTSNTGEVPREGARRMD